MLGPRECGIKEGSQIDRGPSLQDLGRWEGKGRIIESMKVGRKKWKSLCMQVTLRATVKRVSLGKVTDIDL